MIEEFAAQRRTEQDDLIEILLPIITEALTHLNDEREDGNWFDTIIAAVRTEYAKVFKEQGGERITLRAAMIRRIIAALNNIDEPLSSTAQSTATALAVAVLNFATLDAAKGKDVVLQWVTMHDNDVRQTHRDADGQQRPIGEKFLVDGVPMIAPGDMTAPIELWINCRCVLAPTSPNVAASGVTVEHSTEESPVTEQSMQQQWHGVLAPEGEWSGDGRLFAANSLTHRDLPLPLTWQKVAADGHDGAVVVGSIDTIERRDNLLVASGSFLAIPEAVELAGLITHFGKFGVSVDADDVVFSHEETDDGMRTTFTAARICSASVLPIPAYPQAFITLGPEGSDDTAVAAGVEAPEGEPGPALTLVASNTPVAPAAWFANPGFTKPTPLYVGEDGQVFGHIAEWGTCHVGFTDVCVEPPTSATDYSYFHNGTVLTDEGPVPVGHLTVGGGHAGPRLSASEALAHYDSTSMVVADVTCGEDEVGIWCAGWVRPGATEAQVYALRAAAISGDWRTIGGNLELVIGHAVNSPGFPVTRVAAGLQTSLVAAGVVARQEVDQTERIADTLAERVAAALEARAARRVRMQALAARVHPEGEN